eukprot:2173660-Pleurochrysis_carterae.AAC.2
MHNLADSGHGGWLGWDNVGKDYMRLVCELGLMQHLRGFSTNVANYDPTGPRSPQARRRRRAVDDTLPPCLNRLRRNRGGLPATHSCF